MNKALCYVLYIKKNLNEWQSIPKSGNLWNETSQSEMIK